MKNQLEAETAYLQEEIKLEHNFESIVGNSAALKYVLYKVEQVAAGNTTVLVLGESGNGKELIARAIHSNSPRGVRPLVKVKGSGTDHAAGGTQRSGQGAGRTFRQYRRNPCLPSIYLRLSTFLSTDP